MRSNSLPANLSYMGANLPRASTVGTAIPIMAVREDILLPICSRFDMAHRTSMPNVQLHHTANPFWHKSGAMMLGHDRPPIVGLSVYDAIRHWDVVLVSRFMCRRDAVSHMLWILSSSAPARGSSEQSGDMAICRWVLLSLFQSAGYRHPGLHSRMLNGPE